LLLSKKIANDLDAISRATAPLWRLLANSRIFITGGTGFFGKWLLFALDRANREGAGIKITVLSRNPRSFLRQYPELADATGINLLEGDVRSFRFPEGEFTHVIHGATDANASLNSENPLLMFDTIVQGTRRVLDFAVQCRAKHFLMISSGAVYGRQPRNLPRLPEHYTGGADIADPLSAYAEAKRAAELLAQLYLHQKELPVIIARCFAFVGPFLNLDIHFAIGNFIRDGLAGGPIVVKGDGTTIRSYMYAADLVVWLLTILLKGQNGAAYNVGSDEEISIAGLAEEVSRAFPQAPEVIIAGKTSPGVAPDRYVPDISLARAELGLEVHGSLAEAIKRTVMWHTL